MNEEPLIVDPGRNQGTREQGNNKPKCITASFQSANNCLDRTLVARQQHKLETIGN